MRHNNQWDQQACRYGVRAVFQQCPGEKNMARGRIAIAAVHFFAVFQRRTLCR
jgi:hypothetical protein